jgi:hypothetical protein
LDVIKAMLKCVLENVGVPGCGSEPEFPGESPAKAKMEEALKEAFLAAKGFEALVDALAALGPSAQSGSLTELQQGIVWKLLEGLHDALVERSLTSSYKLVEELVRLLQPRLTLLLELSIAACAPVRTHAALLLQGLLLHSKGENTRKIQLAALGSGKLLWYLYFSVDKSGDAAHAEWTDEPSLHVYRDLVGYLCDNNDSTTMTVHHALPKPLYDRAYADPPPLPLRMAADYAYSVPKADAAIFETTMWVRYARGLQRRSHWAPVFATVDMEINTPTLIWTAATKAELVATLQAEIADFRVQRHIDSRSVWDHEGFEVVYESLHKHLKIQRYYVHLLLPLLEACFADNPHAQALQHVTYVDPTAAQQPCVTADSFEVPEQELQGLVAACFQRAVVEDDVGWKLACLRVMSALYARYSRVLQEADMMPYLIWLLTPKTSAGRLIDLAQLHRDGVRASSGDAAAAGALDVVDVFSEAEHHLFSTINNPLWRDHAALLRLRRPPRPR